MKKKAKPRPATVKNRKAKEKLMQRIKKSGEESRKRRAAEKEKGIVSTPKDTRFGVGNNSWWDRMKNGRDKFFATPEALLAEINDYFETASNNPMFQKEEWRTVNGKLKKVSIGLANVFTMEGLCVHLGVSTAYLAVFAIKLLDSDPMKAEFLKVIDYAKQVIYNQKFTGASSNTFNANLIAYDLGIRNEQAGAATAGIIINIDKEEKKDVLSEVQKKLADLDKDEK